MFSDLHHFVILRSFSGLYAGRFLSGSGPYTLQGVHWTPPTMKRKMPHEVTAIEDKTVVDSLGKALVAQDEMKDDFDSGFVAMGGRVTALSH